jgi:hypothetical protein
LKVELLLHPFTNDGKKMSEQKWRITVFRHGVFLCSLSWQQQSNCWFLQADRDDIAEWLIIVFIILAVLSLILGGSFNLAVFQLVI